MNEKLFLTADDVSKYMSISKPMAYKVIKKLNNELDAKGYLTVSGKVNRRFFESKVFVPTNAMEVSYASL